MKESIPRITQRKTVTTGYGDYTQEREQLFAGKTLDDILSEIKRDSCRLFRKKGKSKKTAPNQRLQPAR